MIYINLQEILCSLACLNNILHKIRILFFAYIKIIFTFAMHTCAFLLLVHYQHKKMDSIQCLDDI